MGTTQWENAIQAERKQKDLFFGEHFQLLLLPEERLEIECFDYYYHSQNKDIKGMKDVSCRQRKMYRM